MTPELAAQALLFLGRADLRGSELAQFYAVVKCLEAILNTPVEPPRVESDQPDVFAH